MPLIRQGTSLRYLLPVLAFALAGCQALTQETKPPAKPAFDLAVEGPDDVQNLLTQNLELQRFREFNGLRDMEINRLIGQAPDNIRELVATLGYFSPDIEIVRENRTDQIPLIHIKVAPGPETKVSNVDIKFTGAIEQNADAADQRQRDDIRSNWTLSPGETFTQSDWSSAKTGAVRELTAKRYLAGKLSTSSADIDPPSKSARLGVTLDSGPAYRFGKFNVHGLQRYDQTLMVERFARIEPGTEYSLDTLLAAQQRLSDSGYFSSVFLYVDPKSDPENATIETQLTESKMQRVVFGLGYSTDDGPRVSAEHTYQRIPGLDWKATSKFSISRETRTASINLLSPPDKHYWRNSVTAALSNTDYADLNVKGQSLKIGRTRSSDDSRDDLSYFVQIERNQESSSISNTLTSATMLGGSWTRRRFDSTTFPTRGWGLGLDAGFGFTMSGKQYPFTRLGGRALGFIPLPGRIGRIALRGQMGAITARTEAPVPASLKYLAGGENSVRGYNFRRIGVTHDGVTVPGRYMTVGSIEWQRPIIIDDRPSAWESLVFVDTGSVADRMQDLNFYTGVGVGVRWRSPIGPFQISTAYGIQPKKFRLHLSVGFVF